MPRITLSDALADAAREMGRPVEHVAHAALPHGVLVLMYAPQSPDYGKTIRIQVWEGPTRRFGGILDADH